MYGSGQKLTQKMDVVAIDRTSFFWCSLGFLLPIQLPAEWNICGLFFSIFLFCAEQIFSYAKLNPRPHVAGALLFRILDAVNYAVEIIDTILPVTAASLLLLPG